MIQSIDLWNYLESKDYSFYSGVPCSILKELLQSVVTISEVTYVSAIKENIALGLASGAYLSGRKSCVFMQNSGLGNIVNTLASFNLIYKVPVLIFLTWRGFQRKDAPEHLIMGEKMTSLLDLLEIPYRLLTDSYKDDVDWAIKEMEYKSIPVVLIIKKGIIK